MADRGAIRADVMLLGAALLWGSGFIAQRAAMEHMGPFLFNALRYLIGAAVLLPAGHLMLRLLGQRWDLRVLRDGVLLGAVLTAASGLQQVGMVTTTASRAGFITGLYVLMVPGVAWWFGHRPTKGNVIGVALAFAGLVLFAGQVDGPVAVGDWFVLGSAAAWALHVVLIGVIAPRRDPTALVGVQFATAAVLSLAAAAVGERGREIDLGSAALSVAYSGLFATAAAYTLQFMAQRRAKPTHATVLMSTEALFAAAFGWWLLGELLGLTEWFGGALMLAGALVSQLIRPKPAISGTGSDPTPPP
ncbi:MAG: DMT family transporter [Phycisphaerales bacterium]|nr:DMT family transporter [Planctomycetota bacterium]MCH8507201.1 DMT family transporter [Phycisphaerales bacterium]